jgi:hypothetical protein
MFDNDQTFETLRRVGATESEIESLAELGDDPTVYSLALDLVEARYQAAQARIAELEPAAELGRQYKADLVERLIAERVRAQGDDFDPQPYRAFLEGTNDIKFIKSELTTWAGRALDVLTPGPAKTRDASDQAPAPIVRAPSAAYR